MLTRTRFHMSEALNTKLGYEYITLQSKCDKPSSCQKYYFLEISKDVKKNQRMSKGFQSKECCPELHKIYTKTSGSRFWIPTVNQLATTAQEDNRE